MKKAIGMIGEILAIAFCCIWLFPLYIVIVNSFKNRQQLYENMLAPARSFSFEYFATAMRKMNLSVAFGNSLMVTVISIGIIIILASMTAWMLVRNNNRLSKTMFIIFVATMIIPFQTIMMPLMQVDKGYTAFANVEFVGRSHLYECRIWCQYGSFPISWIHKIRSGFPGGGGYY